MTRKPVKMPSVEQIKAFRLARKIREDTKALHNDLWQACSGYGRDRVLATQLNKLAVQMSTAVKRGNDNTVGMADHLASLADQVAAQALLLQSLLSYLEDDPNFNKAKFREIMHSLDAVDGEIDGKLGGRKR